MQQILWSFSADYGVSYCGNYPYIRLLAVALVPNPRGGKYDRVFKEYVYYTSFVSLPVDGAIMLLLDPPFFFMFSLAEVEAGKAVLSTARKTKGKKGWLRKKA